MEVRHGRPHARVPVDHASRVGEARRHLAALCTEAGFDETEAGRAAIVVTELGTNLVRHAQGGELILGHGRHGTVEVIAVDRGPGIADLGRSLGDGFSTGGTPGTGLGAVRRLADDFDIHSSMPQGTIVVARIASSGAEPVNPALCAGAISIAAPRETACGDGWVIALDGASAFVMVADGLGHGPMASRAAEAAAEQFVRDPAQSPKLMLAHMHASIRGTRGAAVSVYHADVQAGQLRSAGAGNVLARLVSGTTDKTLLGQHGTVGLQMRKPEELVTPWPEHAVLVVHTDGVESRWMGSLLAPVLQHDPSLIAALLLREHTRGRDDVTVVVVRRKE